MVFVEVSLHLILMNIVLGKFPPFAGIILESYKEFFKILLFQTKIITKTIKTAYYYKKLCNFLKGAALGHIVYC